MPEKVSIAQRMADYARRHKAIVGVVAVVVIGGGGGATAACSCSTPIFNHGGTSTTTTVGTTTTPFGNGAPALNNAWVNATAGVSPQRCSTPCAYDSTKAFGSLVAAYNAMSGGDTAGVQCGSYPSQVFTTHKSAGAQIVFQPVTNFCVTTAYWDFTNGGDYSTLTGFNVVDRTGAIYGGGSGVVPQRNIVIDHDHINVNKRVDEMNVNFHACQGCVLSRSTIGPTCCGACVAGNCASPEGVRLGIATPGTFNQWQITDNVVQSTIRDCGDWPSSYLLEGVTMGAGACPSVSCHGAEPTCHSDGMHFWGLQNSLIARNKILNVGVQGIFFENQNGAVNSANSIIGNFITTAQVADVADSDLVINSNGGGISGAWVIAFNSTPGLISINEFVGGSAGTTTFQIVGNIGSLYIVGHGGTTNCNGFGDANVSATYSYNRWISRGGGTNEACSGTDAYPFVPSWTGAVFDLHLTGATGAADNVVPAATCTALAVTDIDGEMNPVGGGANCEVGADGR